jgi:hypothetical protein
MRSSLFLTQQIKVHPVLINNRRHQRGGRPSIGHQIDLKSITYEAAEDFLKPSCLSCPLICHFTALTLIDDNPRPAVLQTSTTKS